MRRTHPPPRSRATMSQLAIASSLDDSFSLQPFLMETVTGATVARKRRHFAPQLCNVTGQEASDVRAALTLSRGDAKSKARPSKSTRGLILATTLAAERRARCSQQGDRWLVRHRFQGNGG